MTLKYWCWPNCYFFSLKQSLQLSCIIKNREVEQDRIGNVGILNPSPNWNWSKHLISDAIKSVRDEQIVVGGCASHCSLVGSASVYTLLDASPPPPPQTLSPRRDAALTHERRRFSMGGCTANVLNAWYAGIYHLQAPTDRSHSVLDWIE